MDPSSTSSDATDGVRVLVIGGTLSGTALAVALARQGTDTTLVTRRPHASTSGERVLLGSSGLTVLEHLGIGDRVRSAGDRVTDVRVHGPLGDRTANAPPGAAAPVSVERDTVHGRLTDMVPDSVASDRIVAGLADTGSDVRVTFEDGRRERFDVVVAADGPTSTARTMVGRQSGPGPDLHEWSFVVDRDGGGATLEEFWAEDGFAATVRTDDGVGVRLVVRSGAVGAPHREGAHETAALAIGDSVAELAEAHRGDPPRYRRLRPERYGEPLRRGRIVLCGTVPRPAGVTAGTDPTLGLIDACVLATTVPNAPDPGAALETYAVRRTRQLERLDETATRLARSGGYPPADAGGPLNCIGGRRAIVLGPILDNGSADLATVPEDPDWSGGRSTSGE